MRRLIKKIRILFWLGQLFCTRYLKLVVSGFIIGLLLFLLFKQTLPFWQKFLPQERKVIGIIGLYEPTKLPLNIQKLISLGLTEVLENGEVKGALIDSWQVNNQGKRYFFYLKKNIFWHDGEEFTAYDVNYNFKDVLITNADRYILKIELLEPFSPLPTLLSRPLFKKGLLGLGSYQVSSIKLKGGKVERLILQSFDKEKSLLEFRFYPNSQTAEIAFKLGEVDILEDFPYKDSFAQEKNLKIKERALSNRFLALFYNHEKSLFVQKETRQALNYATPSLAGKEIYSPILETSWAYNSKVKQYKFNIDLSQNLLKEEKVATTSSITISTFPEYLKDAQKIADSWQELGFLVQVKVVRSFPSDFDVFLGILEVPPDPDQYPLWHSTQKETNITHYNNPKIDKLLEDGRKAQNKEERLKIYADFQRYLVEDAPVKFLINPIVYTISRK